MVFKPGGQSGVAMAFAKGKAGVAGGWETGIRRAGGQLGLQVFAGIQIFGGFQIEIGGLSLKIQIFDKFECIFKEVNKSY
jgi:hypothetical protein